MERIMSLFFRVFRFGFVVDSSHKKIINKKNKKREEKNGFDNWKEIGYQFCIIKLNENNENVDSRYLASKD